MKNITEAILSKSKISTDDMEESILIDLFPSISWERNKDQFKQIIELGKNTLIIRADNMGNEFKYSRERMALEDIKLGEFCEKHNIKNIIVENNTGYLLTIRPYSVLNFKGMNIINKGNTNVTINHVKEFKGGSIQGDVFLNINDDTNMDPFNFIDIPMYYPILVGSVKMDGITLVQLLRKIDEETPEGHVYEYILQKGGRYVQRLFVSKGITPEDFKKKYKSSEYKDRGVYYGFWDVKTRGKLVYSTMRY